MYAICNMQPFSKPFSIFLSSNTLPSVREGYEKEHLLIFVIPETPLYDPLVKSFFFRSCFLKFVTSLISFFLYN